MPINLKISIIAMLLTCSDPMLKKCSYILLLLSNIIIYAKLFCFNSRLRLLLINDSLSINLMSDSTVQKACHTLDIMAGLSRSYDLLKRFCNQSGKLTFHQDHLNMYGNWIRVAKQIYSRKWYSWLTKSLCKHFPSKILLAKPNYE